MWKIFPIQSAGAALQGVQQRSGLVARRQNVPAGRIQCFTFARLNFVR